MTGKLKLNSLAFVLMTMALACATANAQSRSNPTATPTPGPQGKTIIKTTKSNTKDRAAAPDWDGKVQGRQLATPVDITFENPTDYDAFVAGTLNLSFTLRNTPTGKTIVFEPREVREGFRPSADKSRITIWLIVSATSAPLSEAACIEARPEAERMRDGSGVQITLNYAACGSGPSQTDAGGAAQRPGQPVTGVIVKGGKNEGTQMTAGQPIPGIIVKGGKNPGGNMRIVAGGTQSGADAASAALTKGPNTIVMKGSGPPKYQSW